MNFQDKILVATPSLTDPYFTHSVIYLCEHNDNGTMGIMLNQSTDLSVAELLARQNFMMAENIHYPESMVRAGGPVNLETGYVIHTDTPCLLEQSYPINDHLSLTTSSDIIDALGQTFSPEKYLVALGCATWSKHQLEQEIQENSWFVLPSNEHLIFDVPFDEVWISAMQSLGFHQANFSSYVGNA